MPLPLAASPFVVPAVVSALQWTAGALGLVAAGAGAGAVAQHRSQNRPQSETFSPDIS
jgi:hypothetical protein